jgi:xanthine dehydrogenase accessory factor
MFDQVVVVRGGGDLGSGTALRLWRAGFPVVVLESPSPVAVRRTVAFAEAVYEGTARVEELQGEIIQNGGEAQGVLRTGYLPVMVDPDCSSLPTLGPYAVVDAIMAKRNTGTSLDMATFTVALGPGFVAGKQVSAVVETNRGPHLGRVYWSGQAEADTGAPGLVGGHAEDRVLRAPASGALHAVRAIGDVVEAGDLLADVDGVAVRAPFRSLLRGLAREGLSVHAGMKIGDLDPRLDPSLCRLVSDKALAVAGGVLEAILMSLRRSYSPAP